MRKRPLIIFAIIHVVVFLGIFTLINAHTEFSSVEYERQIALTILSKRIPYRDFLSEYPPLGLLCFLLPALVSRLPVGYTLAYALEMLIFDIVVLYFLFLLSNRLKLGVYRTLTAYTLFILAMGPMTVIRYDLIPAVLVLMALFFITGGKGKIAWALLAVGVAVKIYPIIVAPLFFLYQLRNKQYRQLMYGMATFLIVISLVTVPFMMLSFNGFMNVLKYHADRGLHVESTYASVLMIGQLMKLTRLTGGLSYGSWNVSSPLADSLAKSSFYITAGLLLIVYLLYARWLWKRPVVADDARKNTIVLFGISTLSIFVFLLSNKFFSPQFLLWLCPLLPILTGNLPISFWGNFIILAGVTQYIYPHNYVALELFKPGLVLLITGRNLFMAVMAFILPIELGRTVSPGTKPVRAEDLAEGVQ